MRTARDLWEDDRGSTGAIEFLLSFPFLLTFVALIVQLALLFVAQVVVDYAAFNAARSAIVWIPSSQPGEPRNELSDSRSSVKWKHIEDAATDSCIVIAPAFSAIGSGPFGGASRMPVVFGLMSVPRRYLTASYLTKVELDRRRFEEQEPIRVVVQHDLVMRVPIAASILGAKRTLFGVRTRTLTGECTLVNQGKFHGPDLE